MTTPSQSDSAEEEEEEAFEVEAVIGERTCDGRNQFRIKWKSFASSDSTWEFEEDTNCPDLIQEFRSREVARQLEKQRRLDEIKFARIDTLEQLHESAPQIVFSAFRIEGVLYYRVACANNKYHSVEADLLRRLNARLICEFIENKIEIRPRS
jgi:hypothetical protein